MNNKLSDTSVIPVTPENPSLPSDQGLVMEEKKENTNAVPVGTQALPIVNPEATQSIPVVKEEPKKKSKAPLIVLIILIILGLLGVLCYKNLSKIKSALGIKNSGSDSPVIVETPKNDIFKVLTGDGKTLGDEVAIGTEEFYVLGEKEENLILFPKYNLNVGTNYSILETGDIAQSPVSEEDEDYGIQKSSSLGYIPNTTNYSGVVNLESTENSTILSDITANYSKYLYNNYGAVATVRNITTDDLINVGCSLETMSCPENLSWLTSSSYWTGSVIQAETMPATVLSYVVYGDGRIATYDPNNFNIANQDSMLGVRPIIEYLGLGIE